MSTSGRHFVWFCNICDSLATLREVTTSHKLPVKLQEKLMGSKITGVLRNIRKVYGALPGDLPGTITDRVFRETGPRLEALMIQNLPCCTIYKGRRSNCGMLVDSGFLQELLQYSFAPDGTPLCVYSDPA